MTLTNMANRPYHVINAILHGALLCFALNPQLQQQRPSELRLSRRFSDMQLGTPSCPKLSPAHALAPDGGLPLDVTHTLNPMILFMAALSDFAYVKDFGSSNVRQPCGPCLNVWGAQGDPLVLNSTDDAGGVSHCTLFRTEYDIFVLFRGLDEVRSIFHIEMDTARVYAAEYFGAVNTTTRPNSSKGGQTRPGSGRTSSGTAASAGRSSSAGHSRGSKYSRHGQPSTAESDADLSADPSSSDFFVLRGFLRAYKALEPLYMTALNKLASQMSAQQQLKYRVWVVGHSDGSSLAQLAALRIAYILGQAKLGGVVLFGAQRVGSAAFAEFYNSVAPQTLRFQYGWDPATEADFRMSSGLRLVGRGYAACPVPGQAVERLAEVPLGSDMQMVCGDPVSSFEDMHTTTGWTPAGRETAARAAAAASVSTMQQAAVAAVAAEAAKLDGIRSDLWDSSTQAQSGGVSGIPGASVLYAEAAAAFAAQKGDAWRSWAAHLQDSGKHSIDSELSDLPSLRYLAHHMPSVYYDGLMRVLGGAVDNCTLAALQLPVCAVSSKCAAALRQNPGARCHTCSSMEICVHYWPPSSAGHKCDNQHPLWSGNLCYSSYFAPGLLGLLGLL